MTQSGHLNGLTDSSIGGLEIVPWLFRFQGMAKIRRNSPCPCGSGRKYKHCCGDPLKEQSSGGAQRLDTLPPEIELALKRHEAQELIRTQQQGLGKPIIAAKVGEHQIVAVADRIHYSKKWKFFSDFLSYHITDVIGGEWGNAEIAKPIEERHPIMQWYDAHCHFQQANEKRPDGTHVAYATGVVYCYLGLAYNLYLLKHNVELQDRFVARLKNRKQFQGAYYELIVANCLIRAGFDLRLEDETDESSKHCEFSAVSKQTGKKYWVEAKMRSVSGLLGRTDADGGTPTSKPTSQLSRHLREALRKPADEERLIFIDVNAPPLEKADPASGTPEMPRWLEAAGGQLDAREKDLKEGEQAYVFVTNIPFHRTLDDEARGHSVLIHGLGLPDFGKPGRLSEIWKQKQKHVDAYRIMEALMSYPKIPNTFDGSLPLAKSDAENRIEIGQEYFFEDIGKNGMLGEVTTATISESEKKLYFGVTTEDGKSGIFTRDVTDDELAAYQAHPDAYFGVVQKATKTVNDPYDLFEWMVDCYMNTPRDRLLELCKDHPGFDSLAKMSHTDLVLEMCEGWTLSHVASIRDKDSSSKNNTLESQVREINSDAPSGPSQAAKPG